MSSRVGAQRRIRDALRDNPEWRRLYFARATSLLGTWLNTLAIVHLLGRGEVSAALPLAIVFVLKQAPVTLLGPVAGVVADRRDRRRIMIVCDVLSAVAVLAFLLLDTGGPAWAIYAITLLQVCIGVFFDPAYRAVIPDLVREEDLIAANALSSATWSVMFAVGTAFGGFVLYAFGWRVAIVLDALSYLISALFVISIRHESTRPRSERSTGGVLEGLRYLRDHPSVRDLLFTKTVWGFMGALTLFLTLLGAMPGYRLADSGDLGISFLWFCRAVGTGIGPFVARWLGRDDPLRLRWIIALSFGVAMGFYGALSIAPNIYVAGLMVTLAHLGGASIWVMSTVLLQQSVPSEFRGRTFATEMGLVMLTSSGSYLVYASLIDYGGFGVHETIRLAAAVCAGVAVVWAVPMLRRASRGFAGPHDARVGHG
ncbi:MAG: MFS transporter [Myxococcota bacterium]